MCECEFAPPPLEAFSSRPVVQHSSAAGPGPEDLATRYQFPSHQVVEWLSQIVRDPRLSSGLQKMCAEVAWAKMPYAPMLALNYQLGGRFCYPRPEAGFLLLTCYVPACICACVFVLTCLRELHVISS